MAENIQNLVDNYDNSINDTSTKNTSVKTNSEDSTVQNLINFDAQYKAATDSEFAGSTIQSSTTGNKYSAEELEEHTLGDSILSSIFSGASFDWNDEIAGLFSTEWRDSIRKKQELTDIKHPWISLGTEIGVQLPYDGLLLATGLGAGGVAAKHALNIKKIKDAYKIYDKASVARKAKALALTSGTIAGLHGAGAQHEGGLKARVKAGAIGAGFGATLGAAIPVVGAGFRGIGRATNVASAKIIQNLLPDTMAEIGANAAKVVRAVDPSDTPNRVANKAYDIVSNAKEVFSKRMNSSWDDAKGLGILGQTKPMVKALDDYLEKSGLGKINDPALKAKITKIKNILDQDNLSIEQYQHLKSVLWNEIATDGAGAFNKGVIGKLVDKIDNVMAHAAESKGIKMNQVIQDTKIGSEMFKSGFFNTLVGKNGSIAAGEQFIERSLQGGNLEAIQGTVKLIRNAGKYMKPGEELQLLQKVKNVTINKYLSNSGRPLLNLDTRTLKSTEEIFRASGITSAEHKEITEIAKLLNKADNANKTWTVGGVSPFVVGGALGGLTAMSLPGVVIGFMVAGGFRMADKGITKAIVNGQGPLVIKALKYLGNYKAAEDIGKKSMKNAISELMAAGVIIGPALALSN